MFSEGDKMPRDLRRVMSAIAQRPLVSSCTTGVTEFQDRCLRCRIWYSISRTVSDDGGHRGGMMVARSALPPSSPAPAARRKSGVGA